MLLADSANLADVVDKADVSLCCSVAFRDADVSKPLQELGPGVRPYPVPHGQSHFMVSVSVALQGGKEEMEPKHCSLSSTEAGQNSSFSDVKFTKEVSHKPKLQT